MGITVIDTCVVGRYDRWVSFGDIGRRCRLSKRIPPDIITLDARQGKVTLPHLAHAKRLNCATCHSEIEPGQTAWDKDTVHAYCRDCHKTKGGGPTTCTGCHKK